MLRILAFMLLFGFGGHFVVSQLEQRMLYPFDTARMSPSAVGLKGIVEKTFGTEGSSLVTWVAPPRSGKPVILYFHGNAGNLANRAGRFARFTKRGYGLVAMAYRGSSGSSGTPTQKAITADARALYRQLDRVLKTDAPRVLYGESLGTGVAIVAIMASSEGRANPPAAVVLEAPFTSIADVALHMSPDLAPLVKLLTSTWDSAANASQLTAPLFVLHGTQDKLIPIEQGRKIFSLAPASQKEFLAVKGAGHTDLWRTDVLPQLWRFIDRASRL